MVDLGTLDGSESSALRTASYSERDTVVIRRKRASSTLAAWTFAVKDVGAVCAVPIAAGLAAELDQLVVGGTGAVGLRDDPLAGGVKTGGMGDRPGKGGATSCVPSVASTSSP